MREQRAVTIYDFRLRRRRGGRRMLASQMTRRLFLSRTFEGAVDTILDDVIALLGAEYCVYRKPIS
jgi:hypothetical protein